MPTQGWRASRPPETAPKSKRLNGRVICGNTPRQHRGLPRRLAIILGHMAARCAHRHAALLPGLPAIFCTDDVALLSFQNRVIEVCLQIPNTVLAPDHQTRRHVTTHRLFQHLTADKGGYHMSSANNLFIKPVGIWRRVPESNRSSWICNPVHSLPAHPPLGHQIVQAGGGRKGGTARRQSKRAHRSAPFLRSSWSGR